MTKERREIRVDIVVRDEIARTRSAPNAACCSNVISYNFFLSFRFRIFGRSCFGIVKSKINKRSKTNGKQPSFVIALSRFLPDGLEGRATANLFLMDFERIAVCHLKL